jgi:hypothetical protein
MICSSTKGVEALPGIEADSRGAQAQISGIAERSRRIALGVLEVVKTWEERKHT